MLKSEETTEMVKKKGKVNKKVHSEIFVKPKPGT